MPEYILPKAGAVQAPAKADQSWPWNQLGKPAPALTFADLTPFAQGYIEALFFTETEPGTTREERVDEAGQVRPMWREAETEGYQKDMPGDYGFADLAPDGLYDILKDCQDFEVSQRKLLDQAYTKARYDAVRAGHDFWFTRNAHGVGFWDRGLGDLGEALSKASKTYGEVYAYVGDDGRVYHG